MEPHGSAVLSAGGVAESLAWWRANAATTGVSGTVLREHLDVLRAWKADHDRDRELQPGPFLKLAWDVVFGDEDDRVSDAIQEIEARLASGAG